MKPRITVLMTVYNGGKYLAPAIRSVLDQTYRDFELLIVNDCSTDDSVRVIESFADSRIRLHQNERNMGQTKSLNVGLRLAAEAWVACMDADDLALPHWLEVQAAFIEAHPEIAIVSADAVVIDKQDKILKKFTCPSDREDQILRAFFQSPINHVGSVMKREVALALGGYDEKYRTVADYDLWRKMIMAGHVLTNSGQTCIRIRRHDDSLSIQDLGDDYFRQVAEIVTPIIGKYTKLTLKDRELRLIIKGLYSPKGMTEQDFQTALAYLKEIMAAAREAGELDPQKIKSWSAHRRRELILKRIQAVILQREYGEVRPAAQRGMAEFGPMSSFLYFWLASFFGGVFLKFVPRGYLFAVRCRTLLSRNV